MKTHEAKLPKDSFATLIQSECLWNTYSLSSSCTRNAFVDQELLRDTTCVRLALGALYSDLIDSCDYLQHLITSLICHSIVWHVQSSVQTVVMLQAYLVMWKSPADNLAAFAAIVNFNYTYCAHFTFSSSLGWVTPGRQLSVSPLYFFLTNLATFLVASSPLWCHPFIFFSKTDDLFCSSLSVSLSFSIAFTQVSPSDTRTLFYLSGLVSPLFFVNLPTKN